MKVCIGPLVSQSHVVDMGAHSLETLQGGDQDGLISRTKQMKPLRFCEWTNESGHNLGEGDETLDAGLHAVLQLLQAALFSKRLAGRQLLWRQPRTLGTWVE